MTEQLKYLTEDELLKIARSGNGKPLTQEVVMAIEILNYRRNIGLTKSSVYAVKRRIDNDIRELYLTIDRL